MSERCEGIPPLKVIDSLRKLYLAEGEVWGEEPPPSDHLALLQAENGYCLDIPARSLSAPELPSTDDSVVCFLNETDVPYVIRRNLGEEAGGSAQRIEAFISEKDGKKSLSISLAKNNFTRTNISYSFYLTDLEKENPLEWTRVEWLDSYVKHNLAWFPGPSDRKFNVWCRDSIAKYFIGLVSRSDFHCGHYEGEKFIYSQEDKERVFDILQFVRGAENMVCGRQD